MEIFRILIFWFGMYLGLILVCSAVSPSRAQPRDHPQRAARSLIVGSAYSCLHLQWRKLFYVEYQDMLKFYSCLMFF